MQPTRVLPIVSVLSLVRVEYGGWSLLGFLTGSGQLDAFGALDRPSLHTIRVSPHRIGGLAPPGRPPAGERLAGIFLPAPREESP